MGRYVRLLPTVVRAGLLCWAIAAFAGDAVRTPWTLVLVAGTAVLGALVRDRSAWLLALLLLATAEAATLPLLAGRGPWFVLGYVAVWLAVARLPLPLGALVAAVAVAGSGLDWLVADRAVLGEVAGYLAVFFGALSNRERAQARRAEAREAAMAERAHLAREIHDILAHSLSAQLLHLEAARMLAAGGDADPALVERIEQAHRMARDGLEETRRALAALRGEAPSVPRAVERLARDFREATGDRCDVRLAPVSLPAESALAVVRTVQEALTNASKHARGSDVSVRMSAADGWCDLEVENAAGSQGQAPGGDNGPAGERDPGGGYGLAGMRERAELLGGSLEAGRREGVFLVKLRVPA